MAAQKMVLKFGPALKSGAKIVAPIGMGALASVAGGGLARRFIPGVAGFSDSPAKSAAVDAFFGALVSGMGLFAFAKASSPAKAKAYAPFVMGGAIGVPVMRAIGPTVVGYLESGIAKLMGDGGGASAGYLPAGAYADVRGGLAGMLPAGAYADVRGGLAGMLPAGGPGEAWGRQGGAFYGRGNQAANRLPAGGRRLL